MNKLSDVIVVGGGIIGLSCAWALAKAGLQVTVLERDRCGSGASGASLGVLWPPSPLRKGPFYDLHRRSIGLFPEFVADLEDLSGKNCRHTVGKCLKYFSNEAQLERAVREIREETGGESETDGVTQKIISDSEAKKIEPEISSQGHGVLFSHTAGNVGIEPFFEGLVLACKKVGVVIRDCLPVTALLIEGDGIKGVRCGDQVFSGGAVLTSAGCWNSSLAPILKEIVPVEPVSGHGLLLKPSRTVVLNSNIVRRRRIYLIPGRNRDLTVGATTEEESGFNQQLVMGSIAKLINGALNLAPTLETATIAKMWVGLRPSSLKGKPYVGPIPGVDGLFTASGHYKTGIAMAPITAKIIADLILKGETDLDITTVLPSL